MPIGGRIAHLVAVPAMQDLDSELSLHRGLVFIDERDKRFDFGVL